MKITAETQEEAMKRFQAQTDVPRENIEVFIVAGPDLVTGFYIFEVTEKVINLDAMRKELNERFEAAKIVTQMEKLALEVPDVDDPTQINYWKTISDTVFYIEGWCDQCFAGTGLGKYETQRKINYAEDLTPRILKKKAKERGLELIKGQFIKTPDKDFIYGVTVGAYTKEIELDYNTKEELLHRHFRA